MVLVVDEIIVAALDLVGQLPDVVREGELRVGRGGRGGLSAQASRGALYRHYRTVTRYSVRVTVVSVRSWVYGADARVTLPPAETDVPGPAFGGLARTGQRGFLWQERADNAALRQCLHDCAQIKDETRIVGNQHGEIALLSDGVALALGMRRSRAKQGGTATYPHDRTLISRVSVRSWVYGADARVPLPPTEPDVPGPASAASPGRGAAVFLWKERANNAALRQRLRDSAQIKDDTRIVGDQHGEIALLFDGVALALGTRRTRAKQGGTASYPHDRTLT